MWLTVKRIIGKVKPLSRWERVTIADFARAMWFLKLTDAIAKAKSLKVFVRINYRKVAKKWNVCILLGLRFELDALIMWKCCS